MELVLEQDTRHFSIPETGEEVIARTLQPSDKCGGWPGSNLVIREWMLFSKGQYFYRKANREEILRLEKVLGEWKEVGILVHPTLGEVAVLKFSGK